MKHFFRIVVALLLMGGWALAASALYVVRSPSGFVIIPKDCLGYRDTYVDTSGWDLNQAAAHPVVCQRLIESGHADRLSHVTKATSVEDLKAQIRTAVDQVHPAPTTKPALAPAQTANAS